MKEKVIWSHKLYRRVYRKTYSDKAINRAVADVLSWTAGEHGVEVGKLRRHLYLYAIAVSRTHKKMAGAEAEKLTEFLIEVSRQNKVDGLVCFLKYDRF